MISTNYSPASNFRTGATPYPQATAQTAVESTSTTLQDPPTTTPQEFSSAPAVAPETSKKSGGINWLHALVASVAGGLMLWLGRQGGAKNALKTLRETLPDIAKHADDLAKQADGLSPIEQIKHLGKTAQSTLDSSYEEGFTAGKAVAKAADDAGEATAEVIDDAAKAAPPEA